MHHVSDKCDMAISIEEKSIIMIPNNKIIVIGFILKEVIPSNAKESIFFKGYFDSPASLSLRE